MRRKQERKLSNVSTWQFNRAASPRISNDLSWRVVNFEGKEIDYAVFPTDYVLCVGRDEKNSPPQITWNAVLAWMHENFDLSDGREWDRLKTKIETYFEPPKKK